jgi:hypothetical protein
MAITINGTTGIDLSGSTAGVVTASWTTAGRPATPATGTFGFNSTLGCYEIYNGTAWDNASSWTTATRPASPPIGFFGYNTTTGQLEVYHL